MRSQSWQSFLHQTAQGFQQAEPLKIRISDLLEFTITREYGLRMSEECNEALKFEFLNLLCKGELEHLRYLFYNLNIIPAHKGIIKQKENLLSFILESAGNDGIKRSDLVVDSALWEVFA
jgi:hypothetical protein